MQWKLILRRTKRNSLKEINAKVDNKELAREKLQNKRHINRV